MEFALCKIPGKLHRLINSRYPPVGLFDYYVDNKDELLIAFELENLTNPRVNHALGALHILPEDGIITDQPSANVAMASFIHTSDTGSRFNDHRLGAWYGTLDIDTAIAETLYHNERRLRASEGGFPAVIQLREYITSTKADLIDLRGQKSAHPKLYHDDDYTQSQAFGNAHRWPFAKTPYDGIVYDSVRNGGGTNICIFRPKALRLPITQGNHYQYQWDWGGKVSVRKL